MSNEEKKSSKHLLENHSGWRATKVFIIIGLVILAIIGIRYITHDYEDCQWDSLNCSMSVWWFGAFLGTTVWLSFLFVVYIIIKRIARYVLFGKEKHER